MSRYSLNFTGVLQAHYVYYARNRRTFRVHCRVYRICKFKYAIWIKAKV